MEIIENEVNKTNIILGKYCGAKMSLWSYSNTFNVIKIILHFLDDENIVFVSFSGCKYFKGNLFLSESELRIIENNGIIEINDLKSDFQIKAEGGFVLEKGISKEFFGDLPDLPDPPR